MRLVMSTKAMIGRLCLCLTVSYCSRCDCEPVRTAIQLLSRKFLLLSQRTFPDKSNEFFQLTNQIFCS